MAALKDLLSGYEKLVLIRSLQANNFDVIQTSKSLQITRFSFYRRVKRLKINLAEIRATKEK